MTLSRAQIQRGECEHGSLRRKCDICERDQRIADLERWNADLRRIATGELRHRYMGDCPDQVDGPDLRDRECEACKVLLAEAGS